MNSHRARIVRVAGALLAAAAAAIAIAACGGSSTSDATTLLNQTFTGTHRVDSGRLIVALTVSPSRSSMLKGPISITFGGPFQSRGAGQLPESDFTFTLSLLGHSASLGIISTATGGFATFEGAAYRLPQALFQSLEASFAALKFVPGSSRSSVLHELGVQPLRWLVDPRVVGSQTVGGAATTHIHAGINVAALLKDLNTFLVKAPSLGIPGAGSLPHGISAATRSRIAREVQHPTFDLWTGDSDKTMRRLQVGLSLPVSGQLSAVLGGSAGIAFSLQYSDLNQPQTIAAPRNVKPYAQFESRLRGFLQGLTGGLGGALGGGLTGAGAGARSGAGAGSGSATAYQAYSNCIQAANGNVGKMQKCAPLLNGG